MKNLKFIQLKNEQKYYMIFKNLICCIMPPLIVHYVDRCFGLCDGNHNFEALTQLGIKEYPVIIWITEEKEYDEFVEKYDKNLR